MECVDVDGRKRCEMFRDLPSKKASSSSHFYILSISNKYIIQFQEYPDYYQTISSPIAISTIRKRSAGTYYKTVTQYLNDWRLMFNNARTYNQEGSWVYVDAEEMHNVLEATFHEQTVGSGLPGAKPGDGASAGLTGLTTYEAVGSPQEDDDTPRAPKSAKGSRIGRLVQSDESYYSGGSDDD